MHGGANHPGGPSHPSFKHGRSSKVGRALPPHLREAFLTSLNDENSLSLRVETALMDARMVELVERLSTGESGDAWRRLDVLTKEVRAEVEADAEKSVIQAKLVEIREIIRGRLGDEKQWRQIRGIAQDRKKLADTERKLLESHQRAVDVATLDGITELFLTAIRDHVMPLEGGAVAVIQIAKEVQRAMLPKAAPEPQGDGDGNIELGGPGTDVGPSP